MRPLLYSATLVVACSAAGADHHGSPSTGASSTQVPACTAVVEGQAFTIYGLSTEFNLEQCLARALSDAQREGEGNAALAAALADRAQQKCHADDAYQRSLDTSLVTDTERAFPCFVCPSMQGCVGRHTDLNRDVYCIRASDVCVGHSESDIGGSGGNLAASGGSGDAGRSAAGTSASGASVGGQHTAFGGTAGT